ncbi:hypothetical protein HID58_014251 [Brassica napus]|uniref:Uncharacterized protein n=1 Tax=Brassica napus TaxID=3708 RepID=A0ABQ8DGL7_BRANA|nr:hypothetical protein HID58_014251 [Brassica napus]
MEYSKYPWYKGKGYSEESESDFRGTLSDLPTVFRAGSTEPCSSGTVRKRGPIRRRPPRAQRQRNMLALMADNSVQEEERRDGKQESADPTFI